MENYIVGQTIRALKSPSIITLLEKLKDAELNLHEPTGGIGDGHTNRQIEWWKNLST